MPLVWLRRAGFAAVLALTAVMPGPAAGFRSPPCRGPHCQTGGRVSWVQALPGSWVARPGMAGTVPGRGQAYAALDARVAVVGAGLTVAAYRAATGQPLWTARLNRFPAGSVIVAVRAWPGAVTAGVDVPAPAGPRREEAVLAPATGRLLHVYPAAAFGGAVAAGHGGRLVIIGPRAVTGYNRAGQVRWSRGTGNTAEAWQPDGSSVYVAVARDGYLGTAPVTALRRISLRNGAERIIRPRRGGFAGSLSLAFHGVVLFTSAGGVTAYSGSTGHVLWRRRDALAEGVDAVTGRIYLASGNMLFGVDPRTGEGGSRSAGAAVAGPPGLYGVRDGTLFGLDHGAQGQAWGYDVTSQRVLWTSRPLPWPHYFVDLSGIGGSTSPDLDVVLLAICGRLGPARPGSTSQPCTRPELITVSR